MMSGYGYGGPEAKGKRRQPERGESSESRHRDRKRRREKPEKEDKSNRKDRGDRGKEYSKKGRDERREERLDHDRYGGRDRQDRGDDRDRGRHSAGDDRDRPRLRGDGSNDGFGEEKAGKSVPKQPARSWRDEMNDEAEDERDLSDDEETTARKLEESRQRRKQATEDAKKKKEELVAEWVNKETEDEPLARTQSKGGAGAEASSGEEGDPEGTPELKLEAPELDEEAQAAKKQVADFVLASKRKEEEKSAGDMFDESNEAVAALRTASRTSGAIGMTGASGDDWDDEDGYYKAQIGEVMGDRYLVVENICGKGVFSNVVKCKDQQEGDGSLVAIKVMRCNDMMKKAAEKEVEILERLNKAEKGKSRNIVRLFSTFYYRKHLCLVFECMWDDLRAALKKYTKNKGMTLMAVRAYTKQLMIGLRHVHKCKLIHADIKPDNILISEGNNVVKICDFGTAVELKDVAVAPYLVSRFYRAPEIVLGCEYGQSVDTFAMGATLFELFTGKILFKSSTNNDHLRRIMEFKGKIPRHIIKKGILWKNHFDENLDFLHDSTDKATGESVQKTITDLNQKKHILDMVMERVGVEKQKSTAREDQEYVRRAKEFADLLEKMTVLDPEKRISPNDALSHPFCLDPPSKGGAAKEAAKPPVVSSLIPKSQH